jgi:hypothetical protein
MFEAPGSSHQTAPASHAYFPHVPHAPPSVVQALPHAVCPVGQGQEPPEQVAPVGHALHDEPPAPHFEADCAPPARQPVVSQHPLAQLLALQATHDPEAQIVPAPHDMPSLMLTVGLHAAPMEHDIVPVLQGVLGGEQLALGVQETQLPWPSHTPLGTEAVWQATPGAAGVFWSVQTAVPPAHEVTLPTSHGLFAGEQGAAMVHALQTPE